MKIIWISFLLINFKILTVSSAVALRNHNQESKLNLISESNECSEDIRRLCSHIQRTDDLALLNCLQDNEIVIKLVSSGCQHFLWSYKKDLTNSNYLGNLIASECEKSKIPECDLKNVGLRVPCLLDHKTEISDERCQKFLNKVGVFVFSDYHLISKFVDRCESEIKKSNCGRINKNGVKQSETDNDKEMKESLMDFVTSQAHTVNCLLDSIINISKSCQLEILRLAELESDDYHLNRVLYMACRDDHDRLCADVQSGEGRVYSCLMKHKFSDSMTKRCRDQLTKKQKVESLDVKANYGLFTKCKNDIQKHQCALDDLTSREKVLHMSTVLLCLEDVEVRGGKIDPNCKAELVQKRVEMLEDFRVSPEIVVACIDDLKNHCDPNDSEPGAVINCLMRLAAPDEHHPKGKINDHCRLALTQLIKASNPTEDVMLLSPTIRKSCSNSYSTLCSHIGTKDQAFQCLVSNLNSPNMAPECRSNITNILYFIAYDFRIDFAVQEACHADAMKLCEGPKTLRETEARTEMQRKLEYHCMYKHYRDDRVNIDIAAAQGKSVSKVQRSLSTNCANEIFRLIKAQASDINLDPIVFDSCITDLVEHCQGKKNKGREHECLQENFDSLKTECQKAVIEFSSMEDADVRLNRQLSEACMPMAKLFCSKTSPDDLLHCLIYHKRHTDMTKECQAAIEHFQIMSLEEYHIDHRFAKFCGDEIKKFCDVDHEENKVISKVSIVSCLSKKVVKDLMEGKTHPLTKMCRRQFSFELLQRSDSIHLDKNLYKDCNNDITKFCNDKKPDQVSTCLRKHQDELENNCHRRIFQRERLESLDANFDGRLRRVCSQMIKEHCPDIPGTKLFQCLHRKINDVEFDENCRQVIFLRLERRMNDIRLNPGLIRDCGKDIKKHCGKLMAKKNEHLESLEPISGIEFEGIIIQCLKDAFTNSTQNSTQLQPACQDRVLKIIVEANAYLRLDPILRKKCMPMVKKYCNEEFTNQVDTSMGTVHDCLKHKFLQNKIDSHECAQEISRLLREGQADVHVDSQLFEACEDAIMKLCRSETFGNGRKMSCLLYFADDKQRLLSPRCLSMIQDRRAMWSFASNIEPQSLQDIVLQVNQSSMRTYLFSMIGLIILALILLGICCGRVTKRVHVDLKNK